MQHGIFSMKMRDIIYKNHLGEVFKTQAYEDYKILIRNDPPTNYRLLMEKIWEDLKTDEDEENQIRIINRKFTVSEEERNKIETDVKINIVKHYVEKLVKQKNWTINEISSANRIAFFLGI